MALEHSRWESYIRTQLMGHLLEDTVDQTVTLGQNRQDSYFRTQSIGQLH